MRFSDFSKILRFSKIPRKFSKFSKIFFSEKNENEKFPSSKNIFFVFKLSRDTFYGRGGPGGGPGRHPETFLSKIMVMTTPAKTFPSAWAPLPRGKGGPQGLSC